MPAPNPAPTKAPPKGKGPMGIPVWGWIVAVVIGLGIAYIFAKKTGAASQDTGTTESGPNPLGGSDSGSGGGVVAPPPPGYTAPPPPETSPGTTSPGSSVIDTLTDPGNTNPPPSTTATTVFGNPVDLAVADSTFPNAGFATSAYVNESGNAVVGPGGPVIDLDQAVSTITAPISNPPDVSNTLAPPNVLGPGAVIDWQSVETATGGILSNPGYPPISAPEPQLIPPPSQPTVLPHGQVVE